MPNFTKTTFLTLAGSALLVSAASAQPWQEQPQYAPPQQQTTTRTVTTYTTNQPAQPGYSEPAYAPPPPPPGDEQWHDQHWHDDHGGDWHDHGPRPIDGRTAQVDQRIAQLNFRVGKMVNHGQLGPRQGDWFHQQILNVQGQEQTYTTRSYGHLNDWQQRQLNLKLDRVSQKLDRYRG